MNTRRFIMRSLAAAAAMSATLTQFPGCTSEQVQKVVANGFAATVNNLFGLTSQQVANDLFDVDD